MEVLHAASEWLKATLLPYGGIGLLLLAVCDSSFLSLPEVNDILLMTLSINEPESMVWLAFMTTAGSVIGCSMLYSVGRSGGDVFLRRRFSAGKLKSGAGMVRTIRLVCHHRAVGAASSHAIQGLCSVGGSLRHLVAEVPRGGDDW